MGEKAKKESAGDWWLIGAVALFIGAFVVFLIGRSFFNGGFDSGPFRVTLYGGSTPAREWIVDSRPEQECFSCPGYILKTKDGEVIHISGTIVVEKAKDTIAKQ
jgi:hypothetical protein